MIKLDVIAEELFNKIRTRFPEITLGDSDGVITNEPSEARFLDFNYIVGNDVNLGNVSISLDEEDGLTVIFSKNIVDEVYGAAKDHWYKFLRDMRMFSKKRLMKFEVRDINRTNLSKRDYEYLSKNRPGDKTMSESRMYGTNKTSYQKIGNARLAIKHSAPINTESATGRTQRIKSIYVESPNGERFKFPYKHLSGARALARHVSEGGTAYDDFGKHISSLSEELGKLRKFNQHLGKNSVMAETLSEYTGVVKERVEEIKKEITKLQKESYYKQAFESFEPKSFDEVPKDIEETWVDQLTIKQFNEELKDIFPYVYNLIGEKSIKEVALEDIVNENNTETHTVSQGETVYDIAKKYDVSVEEVIEVNNLDNRATIYPGQDLVIPVQIGAASRELAPNGQVTGSTRGVSPMETFENGLNDIVSHYAEHSEDLNEVDRYRSNKKYQLVDQDYNNFKIYVSVDRLIQNQYIATAVSNTSDQEPEGIRTLANEPAAAIEEVKQKLDDRVTKAKKVTGNATLDFNAAFTQDFFENDADELGVENFKMMFVKIIPGPKLVIANTAEYEDMLELLTDDGFSRTGNRQKQDQGRPMASVTLSSKRVQDAELVANGRYILGNPEQDNDGHYVYPMKFESIVMDKRERVTFNKPAVTVASSRTEESLDQFTEATVAHGELYVKFRPKKTKTIGGEEYLTGFADFAQDPDQVKEKTALRKFTSLNSMEDIAKAIKKIMNDQTFVSAKKIVLYRDRSALEKKFSQLKDFYEWIESSYSGDKIKIEEPDDSDKPEIVKGPPKKRLPKGHAASGKMDVSAPEKKMTRYFTIDNDRLLTFLKKQMPDFMNKHYRANMGMFMMNDKDYQQFRKFLQSSKVVDNYGTTSIEVDKERSFAEDIHIESTEVCKECGNPSWRLFGEAEKQKGLDGKACWKGYRRQGTKMKGGKRVDNCVKVGEDDMSPEKQTKTPLGEFILSYFDRETGQFPKGPTAVLTMVEKEYGDHYVSHAKKFMEKVNSTVAEKMGYRENNQNSELDRISSLAGLI